MANFILLHEIGTKDEDRAARAVLVNLDLVTRVRPSKGPMGYAEFEFLNDEHFILVVDESFDDIMHKLESK